MLEHLCNFRPHLHQAQVEVQVLDHFLFPPHRVVVENKGSGAKNPVELNELHQPDGSVEVVVEGLDTDSGGVEGGRHGGPVVDRQPGLGGGQGGARLNHRHLRFIGTFLNIKRHISHG